MITEKSDFGATLTQEELMDIVVVKEPSMMSGMTEFVKDNGVMIVASLALVIGVLALMDKKA